MLFGGGTLSARRGSKTQSRRLTMTRDASYKRSFSLCAFSGFILAVRDITRSHDGGAFSLPRLVSSFMFSCTPPGLGTSEAKKKNSRASSTASFVS